MLVRIGRRFGTIDPDEISSGSTVPVTFSNGTIVDYALEEIDVDINLSFVGALWQYEGRRYLVKRVEEGVKGVEEVSTLITLPLGKVSHSPRKEWMTGVLHMIESWRGK